MESPQAGSVPDGHRSNDQVPPTNTQPERVSEDLSLWQPTNSFERFVWKELNKDWHRSMRDAEAYYNEDRQVRSNVWYQTSGHTRYAPPHYDNKWAHSDECSLGFPLCILPLWSTLGDLKADSIQVLCTLFDNSLRLFRTDPLTLFSTHNLKFDDRHSPMIAYCGFTSRSLVWSSDFCRKLSVLVAHPMWKGKKPHSFMLFAIKWVVICRTDDRHPLPQSDIDLLGWASITLAPDPNKKPFGIRHQEYQRTIIEKGGWPSAEAELLSTIWRMTGASSRLIRAAEEPYLVSTADLTVLTDALDSLGQGGMKISCETHYGVFQGTKIGPLYPCGLEQLKDLYLNCHVSAQRARTRCEREGKLLDRHGALQNFDLSIPSSDVGYENREEETPNTLPVNDHSVLANESDVDEQETDVVPSKRLRSDSADIEPPPKHAKPSSTTEGSKALASKAGTKAVNKTETTSSPTSSDASSSDWRTTNGKRRYTKRRIKCSE